MTEYFYFSVKAGTKEEAVENLKSFGKEILKEDKNLIERLFEIIDYKPLN